jgi:hypothetical protein
MVTVDLSISKVVALKQSGSINQEEFEQLVDKFSEKEVKQYIKELGADGSDEPVSEIDEAMRDE